MAKTRLLAEFGMGTFLRRRDYTQAAKRAIKDALWHNSVTLADAFGAPKDAMIIDVEIGVQDPDAIDQAALLEVFPYGRPTVHVRKGGLDVPKPDGSGVTVIANACVVVSFDMEPAS